MNVYVELWNTKPEWKQLSREEREEYMQNVREGLAAMREGGIEVLGWGSVNSETDHRADYDFYALYRMKNEDQVRGFEEAIEQAGWYGYFEQVNVSGALEDPHAVITRLIEM